MKPYGAGKREPWERGWWSLELFFLFPLFTCFFYSSWIRYRNWNAPPPPQGGCRSVIFIVCCIVAWDQAQFERFSYILSKGYRGRFAMPAGILFTKRNENRARSQVSCIVTYFIECFCFVHLANHIVQVCINDFSFSCNNSLKGYTTVNGDSLL